MVMSWFLPPRGLGRQFDLINALACTRKLSLSPLNYSCHHGTHLAMYAHVPASCVLHSQGTSHFSPLPAQGRRQLWCCQALQQEPIRPDPTVRALRTLRCSGLKGSLKGATAKGNMEDLCKRILLPCRKGPAGRSTQMTPSSSLHRASL